MLGNQVEALAEVREQAKVEGRERRESKIVAVRAVHPGCTAPIGRQASAQAIVEVTALCFELVPRAAAAGTDRIAVQIVELGQARADRYLVDQIERVGERELQSPALASSAETAAAETATWAAGSEATAAGAAGRWSRIVRRRCA